MKAAKTELEKCKKQAEETRAKWSLKNQVIILILE